MIKSINGYKFPIAMDSKTQKLSDQKSKSTPDGTLITKYTWEKWQTVQKFEGRISLEDQQKFYELAFLARTTPVSIVAIDDYTQSEVEYTAKCTAVLTPKSEYVGRYSHLQTGVGATFREV